MGSTVFPASSGGGAALPLGAVAQVASAYAPYGGTNVTGTFTAGTTYLLTIQGDASRNYGLYAPNSNLSLHDIKGGQTVAFKPTVTESTIQVGPHDPFNMGSNAGFVGLVQGVGGGNGLFVIGTNTNNSNGGYLYTSTDTITWTNRTTGIENNGSSIGGSIVYVNGYWVVCGSYNNISGNQGYLYSSNGTTWTFVTGPNSGTVTVNDVAYGGGIYAFAVDDGTNPVYTATTINGATTGRNIGLVAGSTVKQIVYGSINGTNYFVATGTGTTGPNAAYTTTPTTTPWNSWTPGGTYGSYGVSIGNNQLIIGTSGSGTTSNPSNIRVSVPMESGYSTPAQQLAAVTAGTQSAIPSIYGVSYIYGLWHCLGSAISPTAAVSYVPVLGDARVHTSPDGFAWTSRQMSAPTSVKTSKITLTNGICFTGSTRSYSTYQTTAHASAACTIYVHSTAF